MKIFNKSNHSIKTLKFTIIQLICDNELTISKIDEIHEIAKKYGYAPDIIESLMIDCYAEVGIG
ncbi:MAG: hypothetical protein AAFO69_20575 [Bacteroidota bacterium]